jgi:hypothetical protein
MNSHQYTNTSSPADRGTRWHLRALGIFAFWLFGLMQLNAVHTESGVQPSSGVPPERLLPACKDPNSPPAVRQALHLVCTEASSKVKPVHEAIVICFLGGFVKPNDARHPEVWFAKYLRDRYGPVVHVWVFGNRDEEAALKNTVQFVTAGSIHGRRSTPQPMIIVYGHSWGGSQVLTFAKDLDKNGIPVSLTIQVDSIRKLGQDDRTVPENVSRAINFYQMRGLTPAERHIIPADPTRTLILGNIQMNYDQVRINCNNYKWISRVFNKPHHQIENDPRVWNNIASLIHTELTTR